MLPGDEAVAATWADCPQQPSSVDDHGRSTTCGSRPAASPMASPLATLDLKDYENFHQYHDLRILGRE